ncbi:MAG: hypothetical protein ABL999_11385 [Pyrinomonadaceae bacterium]
MIRKKYLIALTLTVVFIAAANACQKTDYKNTATNSNSASANTNTAVNTAAPQTPVNQSSDTGSGPTSAYKAAYAARKNKDIAALKKLMSKDIIDFLTMIGDADPKNKQTLDQVLMEMCERPQGSTPDTRNEKVEGDKATLEYLDEKGEWQIMDFIKEDGAWKLTIDKADKAPAGEGPAGDKKDKK